MVMAQHQPQNRVCPSTASHSVVLHMFYLSPVSQISVLPFTEKLRMKHGLFWNEHIEEVRPKSISLGSDPKPAPGCLS